MSHRKFDQLDFVSIKQNLKTFLQSQDKFRDYDFSGSSMSILLDLLAYNTAYNGFYLNMLSSEMFLDSASMASSVTSIAKHLGYVPRSVNSLKARINLTVSIPESVTDVTRLYVTRDTPFSTSGPDGKKYLFVPESSKYADLDPNTRKFVINDIPLIQGTRITHSYTVNLGSPIKQRFVIPNEMVDLSTLVVRVTDSATSSVEESFALADDLNVLSPDDSVYFIQPYEDGKYEVVFGDGVLGKALKNGNIVTLDYVASSGPAALGAKNFVPAYSFGKFAQGNTTVVCTSPAKDYVDAETASSIKLQAPRAYSTQNRAVTKLDYETLLKRDIPTIEHIRVWGGEENDPPIYGKVFCAIKPISGYSLNTDDKQRLINNYIKPRNILSFDVEVMEPEYIYLSVSTTVSFFASKTNKQDDDIKKLVAEGIKSFRQSNLTGFDSDFRHSKLVRAIDGLDQSIESNTTDVQIKYRITPPFYKYFNQEIILNNPIDTGDAKNGASAIYSTEFVYKGTRVRLSDDGLGKLYLYYTLNNQQVVVNGDAGTVDYAAGKIFIKNIFVDRIPDDKIYIDIFISPKNDDVISLRSQILRLEDEDISVSTVNLNRVRLS